jgi:hypothetical protein
MPTEEKTTLIPPPLSLKDAITLIGGLSAPSKMPCHGYSLPARRCITGAKLREIAGSVCAGCYSLRGNYTFPSVQNSLEKRFQSLSDPRWVDAMSTAINGVESSGFFRWHDSGDLQGVWHLSLIVEVCKRTPKIKHWLPTREYSFVSQFIKEGGVIPKNLCIRFSALMVDGPTPDSAAINCGVQVSGVNKVGYSCPAYNQENKCLTCRACWNKKKFAVSYKKH